MLGLWTGLALVYHLHRNAPGWENWICLDVGCLRPSLYPIWFLYLISGSWLIASCVWRMVIIHLLDWDFSKLFFRFDNSKSRDLLDMVRHYHLFSFYIIFLSLWLSYVCFCFYSRYLCNRYLVLFQLIQFSFPVYHLIVSYTFQFGESELELWPEKCAMGLVTCMSPPAN